jgi:hypothetical protein
MIRFHEPRRLHWNYEEALYDHYKRPKYWETYTDG